MKCKNCGATISGNEIFCRECGHEVDYKTESLGTISKNNTGECPQCGYLYNLTSEKLSFCKKCGFNLKQEIKDEKKDRSIFVCIGLLVVVIIICTIAIISVSMKSNVISDDIDTYTQDERNENAMDEISVKEENNIVNDVVEQAEYDNVTDEYGAPVFNIIRATSELAPEEDNTYNCQNVIDKNNSTAWVEGTSGFGKGEAIVFSSVEDQKVSGINILNGYCKSESLYYKNNRVKTIKISFSDGSVIIRELKDEYLSYNKLNFDEPIVCKTLTVTIEDIYLGTDFNDTCISEIEFF